MFRSKKRNEDNKPAKALELLACIQTDPGCIREVNEDSSIFITPNVAELLTNRGALIVVADGMGGHSSGEVASALAVEVIGRMYYELPGSPEEALKKAVETANAKIYEAATADENLKGMGTTCTALAIYNGSAIVAHVGDSRLYLLRDGEIYLMTEDHSAVMELVKNGTISMEEARHHEDKNVILRALGTTPQVAVSSWDNPLSVRDGDRFLLCSDGLYDLVEDAEIKSAVVSAADSHSACEQLINIAKLRGGHDNITVAIVSVQPANQTSSRELRETREFEVVL